MKFLTSKTGGDDRSRQGPSLDWSLKTGIESVLEEERERKEDEEESSTPSSPF